MSPHSPLSMNHRRASSTTPRRGVSLLEVLLALAILGVSLAAISTLTGNAIRTAQRCEDDTEAGIRCQSQLDQLLSTVAPIQESRWRPVEDAPQWHWSARLSAGSVPSLAVLTVSVKREGEQYPAMELTQLIRRTRLERVQP